MGFTVPNKADAFSETQAGPDAGDLQVLAAGSDATGVVVGCLCSAQGSPDMTVAVASGVVAVAGSKVNVAAGNVTITVAHATLFRHDLIVVNSSGTKSAIAGTPAAEMGPGEIGPVFPPIPASSVVLASVYVPAADTDIDANQITDKRVFVIPPEPTTNYDLAKARDIPLVKERSQTVTLDTGQNTVHQIRLAGNKLFGVCVDTSPAIFIRFNNLEDLTDRTSFTFPADGFHEGGCDFVYVSEKDRIYVMFEHASRNTIAEVNPATMATSDVISDTARPSGAGGNGGAIVSDGTHLYVCTMTSPAKVLKYRLSDFAFVAEVTLTGLNSAHAAIYDGDSIYVGGVSNPAWVAKVNPSDLTFTSVTFAVAAGISHPSLESVGDYLYIGMELVGPWLWRMNKATLALEDMNIPSSHCNALHFDGESLWIAHDTNPGSLTRLDPATGNRATLTFATGEDHAYVMASDVQRLFIVFWDPNPAIVKRFVPPQSSSQALFTSPTIPSGGSISLATLVGVQFIDNGTRSAGTSEVALTSAGIAANTLNVTKRGVRLKARGRFADTTHAKRVKVRLGSTDLYDTGLFAFQNTRWTLEFELFRTGANTQDWSAEFRSTDALLPMHVDFGLATADETIVNILATRAIGGAASDVQQEVYVLEVLN